MSAAGETQSWDRQPAETSKLYHMFVHYRDLGPTRSLDRAYNAHRTACEGRPGGGKRASGYWERAAVRWGWSERAGLWDDHIERQTRAQTAKEHADIRLRHARLAQGAMTALTVPVRTVIDALQQDPGLMTRLVEQAKINPMALLSVVAIVARVASIFPGLATMERSALGMTLLPAGETAEDRREWNLANKIASDPAATDLAIALLDRIAGSGPGAPVGVGALGEPGHVADGSAP